MSKIEAKLAPMAGTVTGAAFENLCLQVGSERAWRMAYQWELKYQKAMRTVHELQREITSLRMKAQRTRYPLRRGRKVRAKK